MKQLNIFNKSSNEFDNNIDILKLFIDGAARNNPGPAGAGIYLEKNKNILLSEGFFLGEKTNNQAEYLSLIIGIYYAKQHLTDNNLLEIISDSELLVRQTIGTYKTKNNELQKFQSLITSLLSNLKYTINHVLREKNQKADKNANLAIDKKKPIPSDLLAFLNKHEIFL